MAPGVEIQQDSYYVAAMAAFAVITATYTNLAISVSFTRDAGILKRTRGSPLPAGIYLGGRVVHAVLISIVLVIITAAFGVAFYQADVPTGVLLWEYLVTVVVGAMAFSALGLATTALVPNADAAPAIVNAIILPLLFLSGIFIPLGDDAPTVDEGHRRHLPREALRRGDAGVVLRSALPVRVGRTCSSWRRGGWSGSRSRSASSRGSRASEAADPADCVGTSVC